MKSLGDMQKHKLVAVEGELLMKVIVTIADACLVVEAWEDEDTETVHAALETLQKDLRWLGLEV